MGIVDGGPTRANLVARVKNILLRPAAEWEVIDAEPATIGGIYRNYVLILAAIPPIAGLIGGLLFGYGAVGLTIRPNPVSAMISAVLGYLVALALGYVMALIVEALAPTFGAEKNRLQAFKLSAYSFTPAWLAGVFAIVPALFMVGVIAALYSLYLFYVGLPKLMKTTAEKALPYTVLSALIGLIIALILSVLVSSVARIGIVPPPGGRGDVTVKFGGVEINSRRAEEAAKELEKAAEDFEKAVESGGNAAAAGGDPVAADTLQSMLPESVPGGYERRETTSASVGMYRANFATASAIYVRGEARIELEVTDMGPAGALAGAINSRSNRETSTGYEKFGQVDGRMTYEEYDREANAGEYGVVVGSRYMVKASGSQVSIHDLKEAVRQISFTRLEAMAKG